MKINPTIESLSHIKVLMYHRIVRKKECDDCHWTTVFYEDFCAQMKILDYFNYSTVTFNDIRLYLAGEISLPKNPVIITFDDGYMDVFEMAFPVMREYGQKGVVFAVGDRNIKINLWDKKHDIATAKLMEGSHLKALVKNGFEIGAHTMTHPKLTQISPCEAREEIMHSKYSLEELTGEEIWVFSYPYGLVEKKHKAMVEEAGFRFGCGVYSGPASFGADLFNIRRISMHKKMGLFKFAFNILTPMEYYMWVRWKMKVSLKNTLHTVRTATNNTNILQQ